MHTLPKSLIAQLSRLVTVPGLPDKQALGIRRLLSEPTQTYEKFKEWIPSSAKSDVFLSPGPRLRALRNQSTAPIKLIPAAGTLSSLLSFRFHSDQSDITQIQGLAMLCHQAFGLPISETMVINAYPTGISLPPTFHSIECGAKPEVVRLALKATRGAFDHVIIIAQPHFLRFCILNHFIEEQDAQRIHLVLGGDWFPHNYFKPLETKLRLERDSLAKRTISLFGVAEIGLGIGIQTNLENQERSRYANTLRGTAVPMYFKINTQRYFCEVEDSRLLVTPLESAADSRLPILRYDTGDLVHPDGSSPLSEAFWLEGRKPKTTYPVHADFIEEKLCELDPELIAKIADYRVTQSTIEILFKSETAASTVSTIIEHFRNYALGLAVRQVHQVIHQEPVFDDLIRKPQRYG